MLGLIDYLSRLRWCIGLDSFDFAFCPVDMRVGTDGHGYSESLCCCWLDTLCSLGRRLYTEVDPSSAVE